MSFWKRHLHTLIVVFILSGIVLGSVLQSSGAPGPGKPVEQVAPGFASMLGFYFFHAIDLLGRLFLAALKMIIVPVVVVSIGYGLGGMSRGANVGRIALRTVLYYLLTTGLAVCTGLVLVTLFQPGSGEEIRQTVEGMLSQEASGSSSSGSLQAKIDRAQAQIEAEGLKGLEGAPLMVLKLKNLALSLMPSNVFQAMAAGKFLPIIVFSILLGTTLLLVRDQTPSLLVLFEELQTLLFTLLGAIMLTAPIGFFCIVTKLCWTVGLEGVGSVWVYGVTVLIGLAIHGLVILPTICWVFGRRNPIEFAGKIRNALVMAFSTASSSATLPVTLKNVEGAAGIKKDYASFVLPLGATVNMDGTAIYESIALVTLATSYAAASGIPLGWEMADMIVIFLSVTLAAVGAAGVPGAGIFMLILLLSTIRIGDTIGVPASLIGLIIVLDRPLDMIRTCVNVWGDSVGCVVVSNLEERAQARERAEGKS